MVTWFSADYSQQKTDIATAMQQLDQIESRAYSITLHSTTQPTPTELAIFWYSRKNYSPVPGSKIQWLNSVSDEIEGVFVYTEGVALAEFKLIEPIVQANWEVIDSFYLAEGDISDDWTVAIPQTYQDLFIQFSGGLLDAGDYGVLKIQFNDDAINYNLQPQGGFAGPAAPAATYTIAASGYITQLELEYVPFANGYPDNNSVGDLGIHIPFYCDTSNSRKRMLFIKTGMDAGFLTAAKNLTGLLSCGIWSNPAAITQIKFFDGTGFAPGTRITVWGIYPN